MQCPNCNSELTATLYEEVNIHTRRKKSLASKVQGHFILENKLLWAWSEQLNKFIQNVNKNMRII